MDKLGRPTITTLQARPGGGHGLGEDERRESLKRKHLEGEDDGVSRDHSSSGDSSNSIHVVDVGLGKNDQQKSQAAKSSNQIKRRKLLDATLDAGKEALAAVKKLKAQQQQEKQERVKLKAAAAAAAASSSLPKKPSTKVGEAARLLGEKLLQKVSASSPSQPLLTLRKPLLETGASPSTPSVAAATTAATSSTTSAIRE